MRPDVSKVEVEALKEPGASSDGGISCGGLSWNYTDGRLAASGQRALEISDVKDGKVSVESTGAVALTLHGTRAAEAVKVSVILVLSSGKERMRCERAETALKRTLYTEVTSSPSSSVPRSH